MVIDELQSELIWKCHICGRERPDSCISVRTIDTSANFDLPPGTMTQNIRYCNDDPNCIDGSADKVLVT